jgi:hypothetical protein
VCGRASGHNGLDEYGGCTNGHGGCYGGAVGHSRQRSYGDACGNRHSRAGCLGHNSRHARTANDFASRAGQHGHNGGRGR